MIVQFADGQNGTQKIQQNMKLSSSAKGLVITGENPTDVETKETASTYTPDNFLIAIQPNGSLIFRNYWIEPGNNSPVVSPVNAEFLGYPTIGIQMIELNSEVRDKVNNEANLPFRISQDTGVIIMKVVEDASASEAGLKPGDIIMRINGTKISNSAEVKQLVHSSLLTDNNLNFEIERDGNNMSFTVNPECCVKPETSP